MTGIGDNGGMTRRTTGGVDTDSVLHVAAYQTERVVLTQVLLRGESYLSNIRDGLNTIGRNTQVTQTLRIER